MITSVIYPKKSPLIAYSRPASAPPDRLIVLSAVWPMMIATRAGIRPTKGRKILASPTYMLRFAVTHSVSGFACANAAISGAGFDIHSSDKDRELTGAT